MYAFHWLHDNHGFCSILISNRCLSYLQVYVHMRHHWSKTERSWAQVGKWQMLNVLAVWPSLLFFFSCTIVHLIFLVLRLVLFICASFLISWEILKLVSVLSCFHTILRIKHIETVLFLSQKLNSKQTEIFVYFLLQTFVAPDYTEYEKAILKATEESGKY